MTTPPHQPTDRRREPDDDDRNAGSSDVTREFWGPGGDWSNEIQRPVETTAEHRGLAATVSRWWNSTGSVPATRVHGRPTTEIPIQPADGDGASSAQDDTDELGLEDWLVDAWSDESPHRSPGADFDDDPYADPVDPSSDDDHESAIADPWNVPAPVAPRPMIDPLLARLGAVVILMTLLVPAVLGFASDSDDGDALRTATEPAAGDPSLESSVMDTDAVVEPAANSTEAVAVPAGQPATTPAPTAAPTSSAAAATTTADDTEPATAPLTVDTCGIDYEVVAGDFWIRIADGSGAPLADLLAVNDATVSTPLYPGSTICLPAGATAPPAPSSTPTSSGSNSQGSPTTAAPAPTSPPATAPPTTAAPTTTNPPLPPASNATAAEVQAIIRAVWPDELEERALEIARRESNFIPTAKNFCCYGVFQVYWSVHKSWLSGIGITSAEQLYDPTTNARAALALYERAGGWGPWGG
jgi:hypothetical protein